MKLKICGMKYNDNISLISKLNPDYMGFIFYNKSKRFFDNEPIPRVNKNIKKVGVFVDPEIEYLISRLDRSGEGQATLADFTREMRPKLLP